LKLKAQSPKLKAAHQIIPFVSEDFSCSYYGKVTNEEAVSKVFETASSFLCKK
jgi:hypothetical protein